MSADDTTNLLPVTDNEKPPYIGTVNGGPMTPATDEVAAWLNRTRIMGETALSGGKGSDWNSLTSDWDWLYPPAEAWIKKGNGRVLIIAVPILPGPPDGSGPTSGPDAGKPVSLATGATGAYNKYFYGMGEMMVKHHLEDSILRLGWEFNGNWYTWKVMTAADAANYAAYWKQIVDTLRTVPGQNFKFCWNGSVFWEGQPLPYKLGDAFPAGNDAKGKPYVDMVGIDAYDTSWNNYKGDWKATPESTLAMQKKTWSNDINAGVDSGVFAISSFAAVAKANNVPLSIPEWGVSNDEHNGGDDPYYIQQMFNFIQDPANNIYYAAYYDNEQFQLSPASKYVTPLPQSAAMYKKLFSVPSSSLP